MKNKKMYFEIDDFVMVGNKKIMLNLNVYRNLHYQVNNKAKKIFKNNLISKNTELLTIKADRVIISYHIITYDNRKFDTMNIISVVDKYFLDALTGSGVIPDDDYSHVEYNQVQTYKLKGEGPRKIYIFCDFF